MERGSISRSRRAYAKDSSVPRQNARVEGVRSVVRRKAVSKVVRKGAIAEREKILRIMDRSYIKFISIITTL